MHLNIQVAKSPISIQFPGRNTDRMDAQQMLTLIDPFTGYLLFPLVRLFFFIQNILSLLFGIIFRFAFFKYVTTYRIQE